MPGWPVGSGGPPLTRDRGAKARAGSQERPSVVVTAAVACVDDSVWRDRPAQVGAEALASILYPWEQVLGGWSIVFLSARKGLLGGTWTKERRIEVYVRADQTVEEIAFTLAHEIAHAVDVTRISSEERRLWLKARGIDTTGMWWAEPGKSDFATGAGDFAESFAVWQVGEGAVKSQSKWGSPSHLQLQLLARLATP